MNTKNTVFQKPSPKVLILSDDLYQDQGLVSQAVKASGITDSSSVSFSNYASSKEVQKTIQQDVPDVLIAEVGNEKHYQLLLNLEKKGMLPQSMVLASNDSAVSLLASIKASELSSVNAYLKKSELRKLQGVKQFNSKLTLAVGLSNTYQNKLVTWGEQKAKATKVINNLPTRKQKKAKGKLLGV